LPVAEVDDRAGVDREVGYGAYATIAASTGPVVQLHQGDEHGPPIGIGDRGCATFIVGPAG